jgi:hypothetical protein
MGMVREGRRLSRIRFRIGLGRLSMNLFFSSLWLGQKYCIKLPVNLLIGKSYLVIRDLHGGVIPTRLEDLNFSKSKLRFQNGPAVLHLATQGIIHHLPPSTSTFLHPLHLSPSRAFHGQRDPPPRLKDGDSSNVTFPVQIALRNSLSAIQS